MNSPIKILIAEDDLNIRQGLVDALEMAGYEVREAPDGSETLRLYAQWRPDGSSIDFSKREIELLRCFAAHPNTVLDRQTLLSAAWEVNYGGFSRTLDQHIAQLRKKLPEQLIETVYGIGYRYVSRHS